MSDTPAASSTPRWRPLRPRPACTRRTCWPMSHSESCCATCPLCRCGTTSVWSGGRRTSAMSRSPGTGCRTTRTSSRPEMGWYIARRIAVMVPVFLGATLLIYGMVFLRPGDPMAAIAGDRPLSPAVAAALRSRYHLDEPFLLQYLRYLGGILHGDLGRAYSGLPVSAVLAHAFPVTIRLALIALVVEAVLGIGFGVIAGLRQGGVFDATVL